MDNYKTFAVKNKEIAMALCKDFELLNITPNRGDKSKSVYIFYDTEKFRKAFGSLMENHRNESELDLLEKKYLIEIMEYRKLGYISLGFKTEFIDEILRKLR